MEIYHLARQDEWDRAVDAGEYRVSTRGLSLDEVGFLHASTATQLPIVAAALYAGTSERLLVLVMDDGALRAAGVEVRWEDGGAGELSPHIYGPLRPDLVQRVLPAHFDETGAFRY